jgi:hypothetical protein
MSNVSFSACSLCPPSILRSFCYLRLPMVSCPSSVSSGYKIHPMVPSDVFIPLPSLVLDDRTAHESCSVHVQQWVERKRLWPVAWRSLRSDQKEEKPTWVVCSQRFDSGMYKMVFFVLVNFFLDTKRTTPWKNVDRNIGRLQACIYCYPNCICWCLLLLKDADVIRMHVKKTWVRAG